MGKNYLEEAIHLEARELVEDLKKYEDLPVTYPNSLKTAALNIIWQMVASKSGNSMGKRLQLSCDNNNLMPPNVVGSSPKMKEKYSKFILLIQKFALSFP